MTEWTDDILTDFVLGELRADMSRTLGASLARDPDLADRVNELRELLGSLPALDPQPVDAPSTALLARIDATIARTNRFADFAPQVMDLLGCSYDVAMHWLDGIDDPANFGPGVLPGTVMWPVPTADEGKGIVWLKMPPGMDFPHHAHIGDEQVLVLQGRYVDHLGRIHLPGTILREEPDTEHSFRIDGDGPEFICLAVVGHGIRVGDAEISRKNLYGV